jgi:hypothetical protein
VASGALELLLASLRIGQPPAANFPSKIRPKYSQSTSDSDSENAIVSSKPARGSTASTADGGSRGPGSGGSSQEADEGPVEVIDLVGSSSEEESDGEEWAISVPATARKKRWVSDLCFQ